MKGSTRSGIFSKASILVFSLALTAWPNVGAIDPASASPPAVPAHTASPPSAPAHTASPSIRADFNGDGYSDVGIAVYDEDFGGLTDPGAVQVMYGSPTGLTASGNQLWTQDSPGILDQAEDYDNFGQNIADGDFNADGYSDLVIGVQGEGVDGQSDAGAAHVIYGGPTGLQAANGPGNQFWTQNSPGIPDQAEKQDAFGWTFGHGDYNSDGFDDLVISVQTEDIGTVRDAGALNVIYGSPNGLDAFAGPGAQFWSQDSPGILDQSEENDVFARGFSTGDFNADGYPDLAVGVYNESLEYEFETIVRAGAVNVIYGGPDGLQADNGPGNQFWTQDSPGILDEAERDDRFGRTGMAAADFNNDGYDDAAIGVWLEDVGTVLDAGAVNVIYGGPNGLDADAGPGNQFWNQDSPGVGEEAETRDIFARYADAGDFDMDGYADLAIGVEGESVGDVAHAGAAQVFYGSPNGLTAQRNQLWTQDSKGIRDQSEFGERGGRMLCAGDFNGDGFHDLILAVPSEDLGDIGAAGAMNVIYGSANGLRYPGNQFWNQDSPGMRDQAEDADRWARWLAC